MFYFYKHNLLILSNNLFFYKILDQIKVHFILKFIVLLIIIIFRRVILNFFYLSSFILNFSNIKVILNCFFLENK